MRYRIYTPTGQTIGLFFANNSEQAVASCRRYCTVGLASSCYGWERLRRHCLQCMENMRAAKIPSWLEHQSIWITGAGDPAAWIIYAYRTEYEFIGTYHWPHSIVFTESVSSAELGDIHVIITRLKDAIGATSNIEGDFLRLEHLYDIARVTDEEQWVFDTIYRENSHLTDDEIIQIWNFYTYKIIRETSHDTDNTRE